MIYQIKKMIGIALLGFLNYNDNVFLKKMVEQLVNKF